MNVVLSFVQPNRTAKTAGPFHAIRLDGDSVRESNNGSLVAHHHDHHWEIQGERYFRLDATSRVHIHFEQIADDMPVPQRTSRQFGPYERFSAVDGIAFTNERVFAFVDSKVGDWFCYEDGQHWRVMVVTDAALRRERGLWATVVALAPLVPGVMAFGKRRSSFTSGRRNRFARGFSALQKAR
jgi:hypothetical protein